MINEEGGEFSCLQSCKNSASETDIMAGQPAKETLDISFSTSELERLR